MKITNKYKEMCDIYKLFAKDWDCDFSDKAMQEMYEFETYGKGNIDISVFNSTETKANGFAVGKKWLNVQVSSWIEHMDRWGWKPLMEELYRDDKYPHWWLDKIFNNYIIKKQEFYIYLSNKSETIRNEDLPLTILQNIKYNVKKERMNGAYVGTVS